jgi:hypothetical protein
MTRWLINGEIKEHRFPLVQFAPRPRIAFVFNEGGRGLTVSIYRRPYGLRIYLAGYVRIWGNPR